MHSAFRMPMRKPCPYRRRQNGERSPTRKWHASRVTMSTPSHRLLMSGHKVIGSRLVVELQADSTKAGRIVAQASRQVPRRDGGRRYAAVYRTHTVRTAPASDSKFGSERRQLAYHSASLDADVEEEEAYVKMAPRDEEFNNTSRGVRLPPTTSFSSRVTCSISTSVNARKPLGTHFGTPWIHLMRGIEGSIVCGDGNPGIQPGFKFRSYRSGWNPGLVFVKTRN